MKVEVHPASNGVPEADVIAVPVGPGGIPDGARSLDGVTRVAEEENLAERAAELGAHLLAKLKAISSPVIREVRGQGLLIGIELDPAHVTARKFVETLLKHGVLSKDTHGTVARFAPFSHGVRRGFRAVRAGPGRCPGRALRPAGHTSCE